LSQDIADSDVVVLATGLSREERNRLKKCVQMMKGMCVDEFEPKGKEKTSATFKLFDNFNTVTHIVTFVNNEGHCPRTLKFLKGILGGKWIVNFDCKFFFLVPLLHSSVITLGLGITTCEEYKKRVPEEPFQVPGTSTSVFSYSPDRARTNFLLQVCRKKCHSQVFIILV
jgi:hypothetical protein